MESKKNIFGFLLKFLLGVLGILLVLMAAAYLLFGRGGEASKISWGASFDSNYAENLGLDWQKTFLSLLDEVGVDHLRLVAFWNQVEPQDGQFDFERIDFQIQEAWKRGVKVILSVGRRLPRWPECHIPGWAASLSEEEQQEEVLEMLPEIVNRYKDSPGLEFWQVENEPFAWFFGECPPADADFLTREMELVRSLDPGHPILLTGSGELSSWVNESRSTDILGISMYRVTYEARFLHIYQNYGYIIPQQFYRIKANIAKNLGWFGEIFVSELQAEPWGTRPLGEMSLSEQYRSFNPEQFRSNLRFARSTGFDRFYLWGAEWWFYAREKHGVREFVEIAKELWR